MLFRVQGPRAKCKDHIWHVLLGTYFLGLLKALSSAQHYWTNRVASLYEILFRNAHRGPLISFQFYLLAQRLIQTNSIFLIMNKNNH